ncbi:MAG: GAF domain-containing protein [Chloroflexi bacterium]|nr:GAF domain-containing protein [Chloroflexota bacterium]
MSLRRLRWLAIVSPVLFVLALDLVRHGPLAWLRDWPGLLATTALLAAGAAVFSQFVFTAVAQRERTILERNRELSVLNAANARLLAEMRRREREAQALATIGGEISARLDLDETLQSVVERARELLESDAAVLSLVDERTGELFVAAHTGLRTDQLAALRLERNVGLAGRVLASGQPVEIDDYVAGDLGAPQADAAARAEGLRAHLAVPLRAAGDVLGVLTVARRSVERFTERDVELLLRLANQAAIGIQNARLYAAVADRATALAAMIQEMHHRIKNNLQTVADLLSLEALEGGTLPAEGRLRESIARVKAIAAVHELLSADNVGETDLRRLAEAVLGGALRTMGAPTCSVEAAVHGPAIMVSSKQATALALVLNELINNALAHGFAARSAGALDVELAASDGTLEVRVADDGAGLPPGFDLATSAHLGLRIVGTLVSKDLGGGIELRSSAGCEAIVRFPRQ